MEHVHIYTDESGDLGWIFDKPYRDGGSSRFLTIASVVSPIDKIHLPKRLIKNLYKKYNWKIENEKKWSDLNDNQKLHFARLCLTLANNNHDIKYLAITVNKSNVEDHIREDENKLYNYMINLSLIDEMAKHKTVNFLPDPRSIKVESGNSLHDYLSINLMFEKKVKTKLITEPADSKYHRAIQFSDMLAGLVQSHFEDNKSAPWNMLNNKINFKSLFFS